MDALKKHYEKLILGVVLVGLAIAVGALPFKVGSDKQALRDKRDSILNPRVKELTNLDLTLPENALKRASSTASVDFAAPNKLFNPMPWQKAPDERLIPVDKVGPAAATVTNVTPLYLRITLDGVSTSEGAAPRYRIGVQREAAANPRDRAKKQSFAGLNSKTDLFTVVEAKGNPEDPAELILEMNDSGDRVAISKDKPYSRVESWMADIRYEPEKKSWADRRVGAPLSFAGEDYNIVAINPNEVVLSAKSNGKKWTIKINPNAPS